MLSESYERVKRLLLENQDNLSNIAKELISKETITGNLIMN